MGRIYPNPWDRNRAHWLENIKALEINAMILLYFILYAIFCLLAGIMYQSITRSDPVLFTPPYHPDIRLGGQIPLFTGLAGLGWTLLTIYPFVKWWCSSPSWWFVLASSKFIIGVSLVSALVVQSQYMPRPLGSCKNATVWPDDAGVPPDTPTAWQVMKSMTIKTAGKYSQVTACPFFLHVWRFQIVLVVILFINATFLFWVWWLHDKVSQDGFSPVDTANESIPLEEQGGTNGK